MELLFVAACICGALVIGFVIGMFFAGILFNSDDDEQCKHEGTKHSKVVKINYTVEHINIICDQCGQVIKTVIET